MEVPRVPQAVAYFLTLDGDFISQLSDEDFEGFFKGLKESIDCLKVRFAFSRLADDMVLNGDDKLAKDCYEAAAEYEAIACAEHEVV